MAQIHRKITAGPKRAENYKCLTGHSEQGMRAIGDHFYRSKGLSSKDKEMVELQFTVYPSDLVITTPTPYPVQIPLKKGNWLPEQDE